MNLATKLDILSCVNYEVKTKTLEPLFKSSSYFQASKRCWEFEIAQAERLEVLHVKAGYD